MTAATLTNYSDLIAAINGAASWLHRSDLSDIAPLWVSLAEKTINYGDGADLQGLRTGAQETVAAVTTTANSQTLTLPTGCLEVRRLYLVIGGVKREMQGRPITPISQSESVSVSMPPSSYFVVGGVVYFNCKCDQAYSGVIDYYAEVPALTSSATTNWLMTAAPMIYLSGAIVHGSLWMGTKFDASKWQLAFRASMKQLQRVDNRRRYGQTKLRVEASDILNGQFNLSSGDLI